MSLPQLPEMQHIMIRGIAIGILTEAQTKAYGQACREQALEDAAIDAERNGHLWSGAPAQAFFKLAEKIRSLK